MLTSTENDEVNQSSLIYIISVNLYRLYPINVTSKHLLYYSVNSNGNYFHLR